MTAVRAAALLHQQLGQPPRVEVALKGRNLTVLIDAVIAEATTEPSLEDMYDRLRGKLPGGDAPTTAGHAPAQPHAQSTLQGLLQGEPAVPHHSRPTMPMEYPEAASRTPRRR
jgi:hypothetical protein